MFSAVIVPELFVIWTLLLIELVTVSLVKVSVPVESMRWMPSDVEGELKGFLPFPVTLAPVRVRLLTPLPRIAAPPVLLVRFMLDRLTFDVEVSAIAPAVPVELWIVPPLPAVVPVPVTINPPLEPVVLSTMPLVAPLAEMSWNVTLLAPMLVLAMLRAVPVVEVMLLLEPMTLTVPPPVAEKPVPLVLSISSPPLLKLMVAPVLLESETAVDAPVFSVLVPPEKSIVPPVLLLTVMPPPA